MKPNTLENYWIDDAVNGKILEQTEILREITEFFEAIHSEGKVYGELSPSCIILDEKRKLSIKSNDILANKSLSEWRPADERDDANSKLKPTKEGDIFNLGCFFYYIITGGQHPFGRSGQRISFIANNLYDLSGCRDELLQKLINRMISHDSTKRPTSSNLIRHPYLWKKEKIEEYIYIIAEHFDEASNQYLKLKDNFLLPSSQSSSVKSVAEILAEIKVNMSVITVGMLYYRKMASHL
jgi:serine/threonine protein kinase